MSYSTTIGLSTIVSVTLGGGSTPSSNGNSGGNSGYSNTGSGSSTGGSNSGSGSNSGGGSGSNSGSSSNSGSNSGSSNSNSGGSSGNSRGRRLQSGPHTLADTASGLFGRAAAALGTGGGLLGLQQTQQPPHGLGHSSYQSLGFEGMSAMDAEVLAQARQLLQTGNQRTTNWTSNQHGFDPIGFLVIGCLLLLISLYFGWFAIKKYRAMRGKIHPVDAGTLRLAAARGDIDLLDYVKAHAPLFNPNGAREGFTALHAAVVQGHAAAALWLCREGADVQALKEDKWNDTALHYAAARNSADCVKVLLAFGANVHATNYAGKTPAELAERSGHIQLASFLRGVAEGRTPVPDKGEFPADVRALKAGKRKKPKRKASHIENVAGFDDVDEVKDGWAGKGDQKAVAKASAVGTLAHDVMMKRGWEGIGTEGTERARVVFWFRIIATWTQFAMTVYIVWRALRTLTPGWGYFYSIPFFMAEFLGSAMSFIFVMSLWNQIERPERFISKMMPRERLPHVDVYIVCYSEPVEVIEPTVIAAMNMNYPGAKLTINILDDGKKPAVAKMVRRLQFQARYMRREAEIVYVARDKVKGIPHHAKAGNINSALLKEAPGQGEFILVLDCDMIVHPDFLERILGHFYRQGPGGDWIPKEKVAFMQTPQDFWNVEEADPMVHCARFFYGPMLQGRDGIGACPCCGTGVVFRRDVLVSIGGQAYGSITEDYNSAMALLAAGFDTMFLNERLVYGMAPDDIEGVFTQRLRWAMGAIQILVRENPLSVPGLSTIQAMLFWEATAQHLLAFGTIFVSIVPIPFAFTGYSPVVCPQLWEFTAVFGVFYLSNRIMLIWLHRDTIGGSQEMWRGTQMWIWMSPNHIKAIYKVVIAEVPFFKWLCSAGSIGFAVTSKDAKEETGWDMLKKGLYACWPFLFFYLAYATALLYFIINAALGRYAIKAIVIYIVSFSWGALICLCIWPPVATLLPREETELGWRIKWDAFVPIPTRKVRRETQLARQPSTQSQQQQVQTPLADVAEGQGQDQAPSVAGSRIAESPRLPSAPVTPVSSTAAPAGMQVVPAAGQGGRGRRSMDRGSMPLAMGVMSESNFNFADMGNAWQNSAWRQSFRRGSLGATGAWPLPGGQSPNASGASNIQGPRHIAHVSLGGEQAYEMAAVALSGSNIATGANSSLQYGEAERSVMVSGMMAIGRVTMPGRTIAGLDTSALLTGVVLPERQNGAPPVLAFGPDGGIEPASELAGSPLPSPDTLQLSPTIEDDRQDQGLQPRQAVMQGQQDQALPPLRPLRVPAANGGDSGPHVSGALFSQAGFGSGGTAPVFTVGGMPLFEPPGDDDKDIEAGESGDGVNGQLGVPAVHLMHRTGSELRRRNSLSLQRPEGRARRNSMSRTAGQMNSQSLFSGAHVSRSAALNRMVSQALFSRASLMSGGNVGDTMMFSGVFSSSAVIPVDPGDIYMHSIAAVPNFDDKSSPAANGNFIGVNLVLLGALVAASVLDYYNIGAA